MLKPIPQEVPGNPTGHAAAAGKRKTTKKRTQSTHVIQLEMKIRQLEKIDRNIFSQAGKQLMEYIRKAENVTIKELNELIHSLQRTVIGLQKKRIRMVRKQQRKKHRR